MPEQFGYRRLEVDDRFQAFCIPCGYEGQVTTHENADTAITQHRQSLAHKRTYRLMSLQRKIEESA